MADLGNPQGVLDAIATLVNHMDPAALAVVRADMDQIITAYADVGANERMQGVAATAAAIKSIVPLTPLWPLVEDNIMLAVMIAMEAVQR
jgi:erythromycin esterase-like protein